MLHVTAPLLKTQPKESSTAAKPLQQILDVQIKPVDDGLSDRFLLALGQEAHRATEQIRRMRR